MAERKPLFKKIVPVKQILVDVGVSVNSGYKISFLALGTFPVLVFIKHG